MKVSKQDQRSNRWQVGDRIEGPEPGDQGVIRRIDGCQLVIHCGDGITIYGRQQTMERMQWKIAHS